MALEQLLGQMGLRLIEFPAKGLRAELKPYVGAPDFREWELLVANIAEFAISIHASPKAPYPVDPRMANYITHKSNTLTYSCPPRYPTGEEPAQIRSEYIFLFTSDCWKLREILGQEPSILLAEQPDNVWQKIIRSGWRFLPEISSSHAIVQETVLLWSAKAILLTDPSPDEGSLSQRVSSAARKLGVTEHANPAVAVVSG